MTLVRHLAVAVVLGVLLVIISITISPFRDYQMAEVACYVVAVAGLTALVGLSGQISLGNGAFMAIGAYAAALLLLHLHWPLAVVLVASAAAAAAGGAVVSLGSTAGHLPLPGLAAYAAAKHALVGLLDSPISWDHHWVWLAPGLALLIDAGHRLGLRRQPGLRRVPLARAAAPGGQPGAPRGPRPVRRRAGGCP